ncbi:MAG: hypothetical protein LBM70_01725 [Victivallales bacterium]|jgi:hypothetical protein|nr:hypothetical protein [Victivallales bacterium]
MGRLIILSALVILFFAGCNALPPGNPPSGEIVTTLLPTERDKRGAENDLVTSLFGYTLQHCPGSSVAIEADSAMIPVARRVIERTGRISGIFYSPQGEYLLRVRTEGNRWDFSLYELNGNRVVWQESVAISPQAK